jgi:hypothetical protein
MEDFLNKDQAKQLQEKSWIVKPKGFYITIYPEDMDSSSWEQVCQQAGASPDIQELTVLAFGFKDSN